MVVDILIIITMLIMSVVAIMALIHLFNGSRIPDGTREFLHFMNPAIIVNLQSCKDGARITPEGEREYMVTYRKTKDKFDSKTIKADNIINATTLCCGLYRIDIHDVVEVMLTDEH